MTVAPGRMVNGLARVPGDFVRASSGRASLLDDLRLGGAKGGCSLLGRLAWREPEHHLKKTAVGSKVGSSVPDERFRVEWHRDIEGPTNLRAEKPGPRDADDRERDVVHVDALADHVTTTTEPALPEPVAYDRNRSVGSTSEDIVCLGERPTKNGINAHHLEHPAAPIEAIGGIHLAGAGQVEAKAGEHKRPVAQRGASLDALPDRIAPVARLADIVEEHRQSIGMPHRKRAQHQCVHDREHGCVGAYAERQRKNRDRGDERRRAQGSDGVAKTEHAPVGEVHPETASAP
jgi:hypothetical protein